METLLQQIASAQKRLEKSDIMAEETDFKKLYDAARSANPGKAMQFAQKAKSEEERLFFAYIADMNLRRSQQKAIDRNLF